MSLNHALVAHEELESTSTKSLTSEDVHEQIGCAENTYLNDFSRYQLSSSTPVDQCVWRAPEALVC